MLGKYLGIFAFFPLSNLCFVSMIMSANMECWRLCWIINLIWTESSHMVADALIIMSNFQSFCSMSSANVCMTWSCEDTHIVSETMPVEVSVGLSNGQSAHVNGTLLAFQLSLTIAVAIWTFIVYYAYLQILLPCSTRCNGVERQTTDRWETRDLAVFAIR